MFWHWRDDHLLLDVKVQPRAPGDSWGELLGERIKVRIKAPPVAGKANIHLCKWLAKEFAVSKAAVSMVAGEHSRDKRVCIIAPQRLPAGIKAAAGR